MSIFPFNVGDRVVLIGDHLRHGEVGTFEKLEYISTLRTIMPRIALDSGGSCFADPQELKHIKDK